ncbi:ABC transporter substrate-binding protein [Arthrobacter sp. zg-Y859]|uniref:ABC transporter substrate-binding protein n=2 Tax=Arthrobacter jinronghuae TaxID=2964609 RepID=A0ABT1NPH7_9MICC|nr:ABC transporter substrate-binding protein [Arthrobacter sp. zg-Y238]MCQ1949642.1 ABC transporter substrate-binding protein [Arthrobacter jinronghuae]MCQ1952962.1 ABC transporter substrate-binding protein [Arthrobacter sp. zg-Y238]UWX80329.1 ABC transporter substrate-binding protein [Arthrobacter jinronghuae]
MLAGCTAEADSPSPSLTPTATGPAGPSERFTFATAARPVTLDPALAADTESYRVTRQVLEGLVGVDALTSAPTPLLAKSWTRSEDRRTYTFELRRDVTFHDGEPFNAEAVRRNFERWYTLPESVRNDSLMYRSVFRGFSDSPKTAVYRECVVEDEYTVRVELTEPLDSFISALAAPAFAMSSPKALADASADDLTQERNGRNISAYGAHPVGTGPFRFVSWNEDVVELAAYPEYWGEAGQIGTVVFKTVSSPEGRLRALKKGEVDGYDLVTVNDVGDLARNGLQIQQRDPYSILYLGINSNFPGMDNVLIRRAVAYAIDKPAVLDGLFLNGTKPANQFLPQKLGLTSDTVTGYGYDVDKARELLTEAGYDGRELPFYYPRRVTRSYLPAPERVYARLSSQLTAAGFNIRPVPVDWSEGYLDKVQGKEDRAFHLLGLAGTYEAGDNFVGTLFGRYTDEFSYNDPEVFSGIDKARGLVEGQEQTDAYRAITDRISERVPAVPLAFPISALALSPRVAGYPTSPVLHEVFNRITLADR